MGVRRADGQFVSTWRFSDRIASLKAKALRRVVDAHPEVDVVLTIGEHGVVNKPFFIYQDFSFLHALDFVERTGELPYMFHYYPIEMFRRRAERQRISFKETAGIFTMSEWDKRFLVDHNLLPAERVHVVQAGINVTPGKNIELFQRPHNETEPRILFIGREFIRKGGDLVVSAVERMHLSGTVKPKLVVAGPKTWPLEKSMPEWVEFLGDVSHDELERQLHLANVLALPSRFEAFGIAIVEALAAGVPVVGRNDFAMPEMIRSGGNGVLINSDDTEELAAALTLAITDETIQATAQREQMQIRQQYSWDRVAQMMTDVITSATS